MTLCKRSILVAILFALPLGGCAGIDDSLDPTNYFNGDMFGMNAKKRLPGERKAVFPEGVPGVARGVPPDLLRGNQAAGSDVAFDQQPGAQPGTRQAAVETAAPTPPAPREKAKPKPKPKAATAAAERQPTPVTVRRPPAQAQPAEGGPQWPDPPATAAPSAASSAGSGWPGQNRGTGVAWPDPPSGQ